ncbi:MAG: HIT domain-containing protein [Anaerolineae bacterium]
MGSGAGAGTGAAVAFPPGLMYNQLHMDHLWTPWRLAYLQGDRPLPTGCLFCTKPEQPDPEAHIVHRGDFGYVILNRFPYNNGHLIVAPYAHLASLEDLDIEAAGELMALTQLSLRVLREAYNAEGFNVGANIGGAAGAGVDDHVHMHIVPRWAGDTNYMTTIGETRLIPEWIDQMYDRLRPLFERIDQTDDR